MRHPAVIAVLAVSLVLPLLVAVPTAPARAAVPAVTGQVAPEAATPETPRAGQPRYDARIRWTRHGIPHITATTVGSLGFGSGYAAMESRACTLFDTILTGRGLRSRWFGPGGRYDDYVSMNGTNLQVDVLVTDLRNRRVVERLLAGRARPGA